MGRLTRTKGYTPNTLYRATIKHINFHLGSSTEESRIMKPYVQLKAHIEPD